MMVRWLASLLLVLVSLGTPIASANAPVNDEPFDDLVRSLTSLSEDKTQSTDFLHHRTSVERPDKISLNNLLDITSRELEYVIGRDDRQRLSPAATQMVWVYGERGRTGWGCSGSFIGSRVILTAAHCLYNHDAGGWASYVQVVPGRDGNSAPFGGIDAYDLYIPIGYADQRPGSIESVFYDYGLIILSTNVGDLAGALGVGILSDASLRSPTFEPFTVGYPGDKPTGTQWGTITSAFLQVTEDLLFTDLDIYGGQSGSPVMRWDDLAIVGVVSFGIPYLGQPTNFARRINHDVLAFMNNACAEAGCSFNYFVESPPPPPPPANPNPPPPPPAPPSSTGAFQSTWARTDQPVAQGQANRTWMWGPSPFTGTIYEEYRDSPGQQRAVQYFDKSRMEITNPNGDANSIWYVTNGLLVNELITGNMQVGDNSFIQRQPANVNVAGDADDPTGPTYATFRSVLNATPTELGHAITQTINRGGSVSFDSALINQGVTAAFYVPETNHTVASVFWEFMNSEGIVFTGGSNSWAPLFINPFYATGYPITEPYWATVKVGGVYQTVLIQVFERRVLTYTPGNSPGWQVEAGNVGQHYYLWRYGQLPN